MACECLPTRLNPLAERASFSQVEVGEGNEDIIRNGPGRPEAVKCP
jgi:hypothetical protein